MTSPRDESRTGISSTLSPSSQPPALLVVFGTRPEAIKLCPLISALRAQACRPALRTVVCVTAQHRQMLDQVLNAFEISADYDLDAMHPGQTLTALTSRLLAGLEPVFAAVKPSFTIVQGDTTTTLCGALASFYAGVPVGHVEAGLRTFDSQAPFPEEMNRVVTSRLATLHFAATTGAAENLMREGIAPESIQVTGNTGIDAVLAVRDAIEQGKISPLSLAAAGGKKLIVVTAHRRESFGPALIEICEAISVLAGRGDAQVVWPVHPNPRVQETVRGTLGGKPNVSLIEPLDYVPFVDLMRRAYLLITDSGGVQEEGPSLGKPVLVLREKTERPEAVEAGTVELVGTNQNRIVTAAARLLENSGEYERMARLHNPYGDGHASARIAETIASFLSAQSKGQRVRHHSGWHANAQLP